MQLLLGLLFFSVLLTTGSSLQCEVCVAADRDCSGQKQDCPGNNAVCLTLRSELPGGLASTTKTCSTEDACKKHQEQKGKAPTGQLPDVPGFPAGGIIKEVVCSKASPSFASFFPAFFGLLLMKLLF